MLKVAINKLPRVAGTAKGVLDERQAGQSARLMNAFDDGTGTTLMRVDDEIARLNTVMKPEITKAYNAIRENKMRASPRLVGLLSDEKSSIGRARKQAERNLSDIRSIGEDVLPIDIIDETKRVMDDQIGKAIRTGERSKAMRITKLKNAMIGEADKAIPGYKECQGYVCW